MAPTPNVVWVQPRKNQRKLKVLFCFWTAFHGISGDVRVLKSPLEVSSVLEALPVGGEDIHSISLVWSIRQGQSLRQPPHFQSVPDSCFSGWGQHGAQHCSQGTTGAALPVAAGLPAGISASPWLG